MHGRTLTQPPPLTQGGILAVTGHVTPTCRSRIAASWLHGAAPHALAPHADAMLELLRARAPPLIDEILPPPAAVGALGSLGARFAAAVAPAASGSLFVYAGKKPGALEVAEAK